ncbi:MAG: hypothetical protein WCB68_12310 [Pyrinomonadaceae bacterium]
MSEDTTKDISSKYDTKPTLEQVLERINTVVEMLIEFRSEVNKRLEDFDVRIDRIESVVNATRSEMLTLRADFREFKSKFKEPA